MFQQVHFFYYYEKGKLLNSQLIKESYLEFIFSFTFSSENQAELYQNFVSILCIVLYYIL